MRILKISDVYFPRVNGVSTSIRTFGHELLRQGHEVTLIAPEYPQPFDDDLEILRVPSRYLYLDPEDRLMRPRVVRRLLPELRGRGFDIVHVHTPFAAHYAGLWLGDALGVPVVESCHTYFEEYLDKYLTWLPRGALRYVARRFSRGQCGAVDALVVPTQPMLDVLRADFIRTARAKGLSQARIVLAHALPNAILPVIAMIGIDIGVFMGGIVVVESVFGWPGIGQLAWQAIQRVDIPIIMGVTLVSAMAIVLGNLLADLITPFIDPRIKLK